MDQKLASSYTEVKALLQREYKPTPWAYLKRHQSATKQSDEPDEHRPITMGSMVCRLFHRLLARRAERSLPLGPRQKAFREGDGLADNVWILRSVIEDCKARHRPLCVAFGKRSTLCRMSRLFGLLSGSDFRPVS